VIYTSLILIKNKTAIVVQEYMFLFKFIITYSAKSYQRCSKTQSVSIFHILRKDCWQFFPLSWKVVHMEQMLH